MKSSERRRRATPPRRAALWAVGVVAVAGCGSPAGTTGLADDRTHVVVTTALWADVVRNVACSDQFVVHSLIPDDADPHGYEPTFKDQELLDSADIVVENGRGLEHAWADALNQVRSSATPIFTIADHIADVPSVPSSDPHIWLDPTLVVDAFPPLAARLESVVGAPDPTVDDCVESYTNELATVDLDISNRVAELPAERRVLVTNHDSFAYFAARYDFEVLDTILPSSSLSEANPADLEALEKALLAREIPAIFAEHQHNSNEAEAIADRLHPGSGVDVVYLYTGSLGDPGSAADTYVGLLTFDAEAIVEALVK